MNTVMRVMLIDTVYPDFLKTVPFDPESTYESNLAALLEQQFGSADFFSRHLRAQGWDAVDVIANHERLQQQWMQENGGADGESPLLRQIRLFSPDVVFLQDLSLVETLRGHSGNYLIAAQCSCAMKDDQARFCDVIFSSFPFYVPRIEALGLKAVYLPLAFEPSVLEGPQPERDIDISFVGGVGKELHWKQGTDVLEAVAAAFPDRFQWWGYGLDRLPGSSPLRACYKGEAWGRGVYSVYSRSKIVLNRHGEVAEGFAQNLRMYEATGCGALLITDNQTDLFDASEISTYRKAAEAIELVDYFLKSSTHRESVALNGQLRTLRDHTYAQRMKVVSEVLTGMLCPA